MSTVLFRLFKVNAAGQAVHREKLVGRLYCFFVLFFFTVAGTVAQTTEEVQEATESGGNTWFNMRLVEHPWNIGIYGGYANNNLYQGGAEHSRPGKVWENGHGWTAGLLLRFQIFNWLAAQTEAVFITKNHSYYYHIFANKLYNYTTNSFVELPVLLNISISPTGGGWATSLRLYVIGGGFLGVWAASHEKGRNISPSYKTPTYQYDKDYDFDNRRDNRFEYGLVVGLGAQYEINMASIFAECRYNHGLSDLQYTYQYKLVPQMNSTWTVLLGFLINPGKIGAKR
jgi:hypothetical protein